MKVSPADINLSIDRAISYLKESQEESGRIRCHMFRNPARLYPDISVFAAICVAYSLQFAQRAEADLVVEKALDFVERHLEAPGVWRYFTPEMGEAIDADLDDTCCASALLRDRAPAIRGGGNVQLLMKYRDSKDRFFTWMRFWKQPFWKRLRHPFTRNDVDGVVNANVLWYLGERPETAGASRWLVEAVRAGSEERTLVYYEYSMSLYYALARAAESGVYAFREIGAEITRAILWRCADMMDSGEPIPIACAISALIGLGAGAEPVLDELIFCLLDLQRGDGSWPIDRAWCGPSPDDGKRIWLGSPEVTTGYCIEALSRYLHYHAT